MKDADKSFAIVVVGYNRIDGIKRLIQSLERANFRNRKDITLFISIDHSDTDEVINFAKDYKWPHGDKVVRTFDQRQGLKNHILQCGDLTQEYDIVTVFEDDILASDSFFTYAYDAALFYWNEENVAGISLYAYQKNWLDWKQRFEPAKGESDVYFMRVAQSWGQAWTKKQWAKFKQWYEQNKEVPPDEKHLPFTIISWPKESSWLRYYSQYVIQTNKYFVYPYYGLSTNFSDAGTHNHNSSNDLQVELVSGKCNWAFSKFNPTESIRYDEYMNREGLGKYLGLRGDELTNDINGASNKNNYKRYVLSMEPLRYEVISSFKLCLHPAELSIIYDVRGEDIFLYDTTKFCKNIFPNPEEKRLTYSTRWSGIRDHWRNQPSKELIIELCKRIKRRLIKK